MASGTGTGCTPVVGLSIVGIVDLLVDHGGQPLLERLLVGGSPSRVTFKQVSSNDERWKFTGQIQDALIIAQVNSPAIVASINQAQDMGSSVSRVGGIARVCLSNVGFSV